MDLLQTILRTSNAEKYTDLFRKNSISAFNLKVLTNEDLQELGVHEEEIRKKLLTQIENLQIPSEEKVAVQVNNEYAKLVLNQMGIHLYKHYANLTCAIQRNDLILTDTKIKPMAVCLRECILSLDYELVEFENILLHKKMSRTRKKNKNYLKLLTAFFTMSIISAFCIKKVLF